MSMDKIMTNEQLIDRFTQHRTTDTQISLMQQLRRHAFDLAAHIHQVCPPCDEAVRAVDLLDQALMLANASIARYHHTAKIDDMLHPLPEEPEPT